MTGRLAKTEATRQTQQTLDEAAVYGAKLVRDALRGTQGRGTKNIRVSGSKLQAAKIAIEHSIGLPKGKLYIKTDALTWKEIAEMAATFGEDAEDNAGKVTQSGDDSLDNVPVVDIPTRPLTTRQVKERAQYKAELESN